MHKKTLNSVLGIALALGLLAAAAAIFTAIGRDDPYATSSYDVTTLRVCLGLGIPGVIIAVTAFSGFVWLDTAPRKGIVMDKMEEVHTTKYASAQDPTIIKEFEVEMRSKWRRNWLTITELQYNTVTVGSYRDLR